MGIGYLNDSMIPSHKGCGKMPGEHLYKFHITNEKLSNELFRNLGLKQSKCNPFLA